MFLNCFTYCPSKKVLSIYLAPIAAAALCRLWLFFVGEVGRPTEATKRTDKKNQRQISYSEKRLLAIIEIDSLIAPKKNR